MRNIYARHIFPFLERSMHLSQQREGAYVLIVYTVTLEKCTRVQTHTPKPRWVYTLQTMISAECSHVGHVDDKKVSSGTLLWPNKSS